MPRKKSSKTPSRPRSAPLDGTVRVTLSLDPDVVSDLISISSHLGISRSSLASQALAIFFDETKESNRFSSGAPPSDNVRRFRGRSRRAITELVSGLGEASNSSRSVSDD